MLEIKEAKVDPADPQRLILKVANYPLGRGHLELKLKVLDIDIPVNAESGGKAYANFQVVDWSAKE